MGNIFWSIYFILIISITQSHHQIHSEKRIMIRNDKNSAQQAIQRKELEQEIDKPIVSNENYLHLTEEKKKFIKEK